MLNLAENQLTCVDNGIGQLQHLRTLDLRWNPLGTIPNRVDELERRGCTVLV